VQIPTFHCNHGGGYVTLFRELYTELLVSNLRRYCERGERAAVMGSYLGILLEEKTLIADLKHKNNTWMLFLYV